ncbi:MAG: phytoene/squalene synthase family protein [Planctomycetota bacterium]
MTHPAVDDQLFARTDPQEVLRSCGRTFYAASKVLPAAVADDLALLYAFCRVVDDCADLADQSRSADLLDEIERCLEGRSDRSPVVTGFRALAARHGVPLRHARDLIQGVRSDAADVRVQTESELIRYAYRVASTVGLMMCRILGVPEEGDPFAIDLGIGMQLTNICRDVAEDAAIDRVYLPAAWIDAGRVIGAATNNDDRLATAAAVERGLTLADKYYDSAELGMHFLPLRVRGGIRAAAWSYRAIGDVIRRRPTEAVSVRAATSAAGKLVRTGAAVWASVLESLPLGPADRHDSNLHTALRPLGLNPYGSVDALRHA